MNVSRIQDSNITAYGKSSNICLLPTENNYFPEETRIKLQSLDHED